MADIEVFGRGMLNSLVCEWITRRFIPQNYWF
jgi:hypothetical protein